MTDSEYLLSLLDETFAAVPQIKAHHERMRQIAARLATHPLAAAAPQPEAEAQKAVATVTKAGMLHATAHGIKTLKAGDKLYAAPTPQAVKAPLTEAQAIAANPYINDPARQALWLAAIRFAERAHLIGLETKGDGNG